MSSSPVSRTNFVIAYKTYLTIPIYYRSPVACHKFVTVWTRLSILELSKPLKSATLLNIAYFTALHALGSWLAVNMICCYWGDFYEMNLRCSRCKLRLSRDALVVGVQSLIIVGRSTKVGQLINLGESTEIASVDVPRSHRIMLRTEWK